MNRLPINKRKITKHTKRKNIFKRLNIIFVIYKYIKLVKMEKIIDSKIEAIRFEKIIFIFLCGLKVIFASALP